MRDTGADEVREPGWYRDPGDLRLHRYWNGTAWLSQDEFLDSDPQGSR